MKHYVGIDVSKSRLDVCIMPDNTKLSCGNNEKGILELLNHLKPMNTEMIALEATGGYETLLSLLLSEADLPVRIINPRQVRDFAKATGQLAKTDSIDALIIAEFARCLAIERRTVKNRKTRLLDEMLKRRTQLVDMQTSEKNRLQKPTISIQKSVKEHLKYLKNEISKIDKLIKKEISQSPEWREKDEILQSIPGVGPMISTTILSSLPELGTINRKKAAKLVGVAPLNQDSGKKTGKRRIWGGRKNVRCALYMGIISAIRFNKKIKQYYDHLLEKGKPVKVALTACIRKLLKIMNVMIANKTKWTEYL